MRLRLENLARLAETAAPDVICLQELKASPEDVPLAAIERLGYLHHRVKSEKGYNGVGIFSKLPIESGFSLDWAGKTDARHICAAIGGVEIHNFYVPAGGDIPDTAQNPKFKHKLDFVEHMTQWFSENRTGGHKMILAGDLNIAPLPSDVWSHKQLLSVVSHTPQETTRMEGLRASLSWVDAVRHFAPEPQKIYSWWSYRNQDWKKSDRGRRLDHIWVSPALENSLRSFSILRDARDWPAPSDHVPVVVEMEG